MRVGSSGREKRGSACRVGGRSNGITQPCWPLEVPQRERRLNIPAAEAHQAGWKCVQLGRQVRAGCDSIRSQRPPQPQPLQSLHLCRREPF